MTGPGKTLIILHKDDNAFDLLDVSLITRGSKCTNRAPHGRKRRMQREGWAARVAPEEGCD